MLCKRFTTYFVYNFTLLCFIEPSMSIIKTKTTLYQPPTVLIFVCKQKNSICSTYSSKYEIEKFIWFIFIIYLQSRCKFRYGIMNALHDIILKKLFSASGKTKICSEKILSTLTFCVEFLLTEFFSQNVLKLQLREILKRNQNLCYCENNMHAM